MAAVGGRPGTSDDADPAMPSRHFPVEPGPRQRSRLTQGLRASDIAFALIAAAIEALTAVRLGVTWDMAAMLVFFAGGMVLARWDFVYLRLPRRLLYPTVLCALALLVVASGTTDQWSRFGRAAVCGLAAFLVFFVPNAINPRAMAFGDVRLAGAIGLVVGWFSVRCVIEAFLAASLLGAAVSLVLLAGHRIDRNTALPYGVFLVAGGVVAVLVSGPVAVS